MTKKLHQVEGFLPCCEIDLTKTERQNLIDISKSLSTDARLEIILFIGTHHLCNTSDLVRHLPLAQSTISQHMKVLCQSGVVNITVQGTSSVYSLNTELLSQYREILSKLL